MYRWKYSDSDEYLEATYRIQDDSNGSKPSPIKLMRQVQTTLESFLYSPDENGKNIAGIQIKDFWQSKGETFCTISLPTKIFGVNDPGQLFALLSIFSEEKFLAKLEDFNLPKSFSVLSGPKFGLKGFREMLGIFDSPLLGLSMKLRYPFSLQKYGEICEEAYIGGVDYIIDDEFFLNPFYAPPFQERVKTLCEITAQCSKILGKRKICIVNVSCGLSSMVNLAKTATELGVNAISVNPFTVGFPAFAVLKEETNIPVVAINRGVSVMTRSPKIGFSEKAVAKLTRLCGADAVSTGAYTNSTCFNKNELKEISEALREEFAFKPSIPLISGGINPQNIWTNLKILGNDVMIQAGNGILSHPEGSKGGAYALRTIIDNVEIGLSAKDAKLKLRDLSEKHASVRNWFLHRS